MILPGLWAEDWVCPRAARLGLVLAGMVLAMRVQGAEPATPAIETSNPKLARAFGWATDKALSYVQTGKTGMIDRHEGDKLGSGPVPYMPCYWAGYAFRTAFYSRDYCHQAVGAHLLGLQRENLAMLQAFAASATAGRKWYPLWALNFDGSPFKLDFRGDHSFVREVPAVFELGGAVLAAVFVDRRHDVPSGSGVDELLRQGGDRVHRVA
jgi:hypothetical protein